ELREGTQRLAVLLQVATSAEVCCLLVGSARLAGASQALEQASLQEQRPVPSGAIFQERALVHAKGPLVPTTRVLRLAQQPPEVRLAEVRSHVELDPRGGVFRLAPGESDLGE